MALDQRKYERKHEDLLRDVRPLSTRFADGLSSTTYSTTIFIAAGISIHVNEWMLTFADLIMAFMLLYFLWLMSRERRLPFKMPMSCKYKDPNNGRDGRPGKSEGIMYLGNTQKTNEEVWFTNSDIRTHILYLGTTGAGKTEGLKSLATNAIAWGSGFVYVDGKADTDLWSSLSSLVRRFGRDDDLLVLNYMTGNSDVAAPSNTMNPFSSGSASYLTNMLVSLMPESGGDNAMWKERAVSLVGAMMPALTWKRDYQEIPMSVRTIRDYLSLNNVIKLSRDEVVPAEIRVGLVGYLDTLPGFIGEAYDDEGKVKPPGPDTPQYNTETASQQHGYLAMQFTRSLQSLGDDYGYIFDTQAADVDMVDVVLNRRILVVLVPALEKSGDEVANLGKIVAASIKGMMGSTLGSTVEGSSETVIENKPTHSSTPFLTVFDEVGYYVAEGMAVMAAQARSLGFSLVFAGQDLPAMKKRVREEAQSITANCNLKLFGKLEDPTETKDFFEKTVGSAMVVETSGFQMSGGSEMGAYHDTKQAGVQLRPRANYDGLRGFKEGQAIVTFGEAVVDVAVFYSNPGFAKAMRVTRFMSLPPPEETLLKHSNAIRKLRDLMVNKTWTAMRADVAVDTPDEIAALNDGFTQNKKPSVDPVESGICAIIQVHALTDAIPEAKPKTAAPSTAQTKPTTPPAQKPASPIAGIGAKKPEAETPQAPTEQQPAPQEETKATAKPSIFGGAKQDTAETTTAQTAPVQTAQDTPAAAPATPPAEAPKEEKAKPAIFGAKTETTTPASTTPPTTPAPAAPPAEAPPQPGQDTPAATPAEETPQAPTEQQSAPQEETKAAAKPAIFGAKQDTAETTTAQTAPVQTAQDTPAAAPATPPAEAPKEEKAKPAIFGAKTETTTPASTTPPTTPAPAAPPAEAPPQPGQDTPAATPAEETPQAPTEQQSAPQEETKAAAKPAIFGAKQDTAETTTAQTAPVQTAQDTPAAVPATPPAEAPKEEKAKPAIFGAPPKKKDEDGESE